MTILFSSNPPQKELKWTIYGFSHQTKIYKNINHKKMHKWLWWILHQVLPGEDLDLDFMSGSYYDLVRGGYFVGLGFMCLCMF